MITSKPFLNRSVLAIILALLSLSSRLAAQDDRGSLAGRVTDPKGAVVRGASVTITNDATQVAEESKSNSSGEFSFSTLNPGHYTVAVTASGFRTYKEEHIQVDVGITATINASLKLGNSTMEVTVIADAQQLQTSSADLGMTIEEKSMTDLPLIYGNPFALEFLSPGITLSGVNPNIHVYDSSTATVSVNGSSLNSIDYKLDGAPDNRLRFTAYSPSTESISQYRVSTSSYDAAQGHSSGGFVAIQSKSGTSLFHGSIYAYYQNPKINADTWVPVGFAATSLKPTFVREGADVGGPIIKEKLFFFAGYEHSRQESPGIMQFSIPTLAERSGDFSALIPLDTTPNAQQCGSTPTVLTATPAAPINQYQLFDPLAVVPTSGTNYARLCVPGNIIPKSRINPVATNIMSYYPGGANSAVPASALGATTAKNTLLGLNNYNWAASYPDVYYGALVRLDYTINQQQSMYAHLYKSQRINVHGTDYFDPVAGIYLEYDNTGIDVGHTFVLSPTTVINSVLSFTHFTNFQNSDASGKVTPTSIGMPSYLTNGLPIYAQSLPTVNITDYEALTGGYQGASYSYDDIWQGSVSISKQAGAHFFHVGMEYRRYLTNGANFDGEYGNYTSSGSFDTANNSTNNAVGGAGFSIAQLEYGLLNSGSQTQNANYALRSDYYAGYFQDAWRASAKFTLTMGLRWEYETPSTERNGKQTVGFNFNAINSSTVPGSVAYLNSGIAGAPITGLSVGQNFPASISPTGGLVFANTDGYNNQPYKSPTHELSPRLGFSYAANSKTVFRGGYGIFFDSLESLYINGASGTPGGAGIANIPQIGFSAITNIAIPTLTSNGLSVTSTISDPFPSGLTPVTGNSLGASTALGQNIQFLERNPHTPYNQRWSIGFQRQFGQFIMALDYVGNHGVHQLVTQVAQSQSLGGVEYNNVPAQYYSNLDGVYDYKVNTALNTTVANPFSQLLPSGAVNNLGTAQVATAQLLRPYPEFGSINSPRTDGTSIYHSLQAQVQRRFTNGLSFTGAFTWSRDLDSTTLLNPVDVSPWHGLSNNDRPLRFSTSGIYQLPWGRGRKWLNGNHGIVASVVGGWQMQGVYQIQSGAPLTFNRDDVYLGAGNPGNSHWSRAQYKKTGYWFDTTKWLQTATNATATATGPNPNAALQCGTGAITYNAATGICTQSFPGTYQIRRFPLRFNSLRSDNLNQADVGLQREFQVYKYGVLQFRVEAVNALNHPVYPTPTIDPEVSTFGQLIAGQANQPRVYQFAGFFRF